MRKLVTFATRLRDDRSGLALLEFAFSLPIVLTMSLTGAELTNYITTRMRVSQVALQLADNAARIGSGTVLQTKKITETDINDLLTGAGLQAGELNLYGRGRVIVSDLEADPSNSGKYKIMWQRCSGTRTAWTSSYGKVGDTSGSDRGNNLTGMGPTGRQITSPPGGATMFVEVRYEYRPIVNTSLTRQWTGAELKEFASMMVRDNRDLSQIYNTANAPVARCPWDPAA